MPQGKCTIEVPVTAQAAFDLIHDYKVRLNWDSMLSEARLLNGATQPARGVRSRCVGNWKCVWLPIEAEYITYTPGEVAAVRMTNRPLFFEQFAAAILHDDLDVGRSQVTYIYNFDSKPRWLAWFFEPVMNFCLKREVNHRLRALRSYAQSQTYKARSQ